MKNKCFNSLTNDGVNRAQQYKNLFGELLQERDIEMLNMLSQ